MKYIAPRPSSTPESRRISRASQMTRSPLCDKSRPVGAYALRKGFTVSDEWIITDDGISGAEFTRRPGLMHLMNCLRPRPSFQVLIMTEESRLGRETLETGFLFKQILAAGVRVF